MQLAGYISVYVFQYMEENKDKPVISICQMAEALRTQYRYYFLFVLSVQFLFFRNVVKFYE